MVSFVTNGDFRKANSFFERLLDIFHISILDKYGHQGVIALENATPKDTGETSKSWYYTIERSKNGVSINWCNSNINEGVPIAILIQYGHAAVDGSYVQGNDYINPTIKPIFDKMAEELWKEVTK